MAAWLKYDLSLSTYTDFTAYFVFGQTLQELTDFSGATAQMMIREAPTDQNPLLALSTTASPEGQIYLGIAPPGPLAATVANIAALEVYDASALTSGTLVNVTTPSSYYAWQPSGALPVDGVTVVAATGGGQWWLCATVAFKITNAAMLPLVGTVQASYDLIVTWSDATKTRVLEGAVYVDQSDTFTNP